mmetsp:Transcript_55169/g.161008  ORF Transcript_55169/g.161008 Transcript_55169/m.161008 type:complete len:265 (-) Transcript_55169:255-1049(-)
MHALSRHPHNVGLLVEERRDVPHVLAVHVLADAEKHDLFRMRRQKGLQVPEHGRESHREQPVRCIDLVPLRIPCHPDVQSADTERQLLRDAEVLGEHPVRKLGVVLKRVRSGVVSAGQREIEHRSLLNFLMSHPVRPQDAVALQPGPVLADQAPDAVGPEPLPTDGNGHVLHAFLSLCLQLQTVAACARRPRHHYDPVPPEQCRITALRALRRWRDGLPLCLAHRRLSRRLRRLWRRWLRHRRRRLENWNRLQHLVAHRGSLQQ